jgi:hypothetical protein
LQIGFSSSDMSRNTQKFIIKYPLFFYLWFLTAIDNELISSYCFRFLFVIKQFKKIYIHIVRLFDCFFYLPILFNFIYAEKLPTYFIYDNACHLKPFIENNNMQKTERGKTLLRKTFVIDRLHLKNHVSPHCKLNYNPDLYDDL